MLKPAESRYSKIEQACLALVFLCGWEAPSLPPVWEGSFDHEVWSDQAEATGPLLRLSEFDITCTSRKAMKGQAIADLLAEYPVEDSTDLFYWWSSSLVAIPLSQVVEQTLSSNAEVPRCWRLGFPSCFSMRRWDISAWSYPITFPILWQSLVISLCSDHLSSGGGSLFWRTPSPFP